jgi:hypothetical protein
MNSQNVVVLGASPKPSRYSNKAVQELLTQGHHVFPIHPSCAEIYGQKCYKHLDEITCKVDTLTLYVGEEKSTPLIENLLGLKPQRIVMNPGTENDLLEAKAIAQGITVIRGCTLVMLRTNQF